jgi:hypothetical protein
LPSYLTAEYEAALRQLAEFGLQELRGATDEGLVRCILAVVAIWKHRFLLGRLAMDFDEEELADILKKSGWDNSD